MENNMSTLIQLRDKHKVNKPVGYVSTYHDRFEKFRDKETRILEIGLLTGGPEIQASYVDRDVDNAPSMNMWAEYFANGDVWGADICDFSHVAEKNNFNFVKTDQSYEDKLLDIPKQVCNLNQTYDEELFDIIIDDGSHASFHQQNTFFTLFPYLKKGGVYVIEDLHWKPHWDPTRKKIKPFIGDVPHKLNTIATETMLETMEAIVVFNNSNSISSQRMEEVKNKIFEKNNLLDKNKFPFVEKVQVYSNEIEKINIYKKSDFDPPKPHPDNRFTLCVIEKKQ